MEPKQLKVQAGDHELVFETGKIAKQANGAVTIRCNDTIVFSSACADKTVSAEVDFLPLRVDYQEKFSSVGRTVSGFIKREGRPTTKETLTARLMDRPIRPLFPKGFNDEVQCQAIVISSDRQTDADMLAMNGVAAALLISPLPFQGPVASARVGRVGGEWVAFPTADDLEDSDVDLIVSGSEEAVTMIEGFAREVPESEMLDAIRFAHDVIREVIGLQRELAAQVQIEKIDFVESNDTSLIDTLKDRYYDEFRQAKQTSGKQARADAVRALKERMIGEMIPDANAEGAISGPALSTAWHDLEGRVVRDLILDGTRPDGRDGKTLRDIQCFVDVLPRTHGSAVFQRGETQALVSVTLGTARDEQRVDGLMEEYSKKFMLDY
ncbi:MAG: polyribonucleotide nucleotidyltransferase, partial [Chlamydiia bacterium]|nr:polyribonucleotide nucleotidyltransferase [Chlamydiia bacterium]